MVLSRRLPLRWLPLRWFAVAALAAVLPLVACAQPDQNGQGPGSGATSLPTTPGMVSVKIIRTGGFAGVNQILEIAPDGSWVYTDKRAGTSQRGQITPAQQAELARMVTNPDFLTQARQKPGPSVCNDTFIYAISIGDLSTQFDDCGDKSERPAVQAVLSALASMTPL